MSANLSKITDFWTGNSQSGNTKVIKKVDMKSLDLEFSIKIS